jgi:hypothetical protein
MEDDLRILKLDDLSILIASYSNMTKQISQMIKNETHNRSIMEDYIQKKIAGADGGLRSWVARPSAHRKLSGGQGGPPIFLILYYDSKLC